MEDSTSESICTADVDHLPDVAEGGEVLGC